MTDPAIRRPVVLLGPARSGTTMLFSTMSSHPELWSLYRESDAIIERFFPVAMTPGSSDVVAAGDVDDATATAISQEFWQSVGKMGGSQVPLSEMTARFMRTRLGRGVLAVPGLSRLRLSMITSRVGRQSKPDSLRMVEKTPENCMRVELLERVFDEPLYVHLTRDPRAAIASIYAGWQDKVEFKRFQLPAGYTIGDYAQRHWCFGLMPGWERLDGAELIEICAHQWLAYSTNARRSLAAVGDRSIRVAYEDLVDDPRQVLRRIADWARLDHGPFDRFVDGLPVVNAATQPDPDKWTRIKDRIDRVVPLVAEEAEATGYSI